MEKAIALIRPVVNRLDPKMGSVFLPWAMQHPRYLRSFISLMRSHRRTRKSRANMLKSGVKVPPFLIISITSRCNLRCPGCFAAAAGTIGDASKAKPGLSFRQWHGIISEARKLGVFGFVIAGGEPFLFPRLIELCESFKDSLFIILTNGTTLREKHYERLGKTSNIAVLVSIEGDRRTTDGRRGHGVHRKAMEALGRLNELGVLAGISVTITRKNFRYWMDERVIDGFIADGVRIGAFMEYIPTTPGNTKGSDHGMMLSEHERARFRARMLEFRDEKRMYTIHSPGDEEYFGGCVSAGRGFAHITPAGDLTPCPVSNIATHNLTKSGLRDALAGRLFREIRENEHLLENEGTPCALFAHPKEVDVLAKRVGAYRTGN